MGLSHNSLSQSYVMFASLSGDSGANVGLTQQECSAFHNPPLSSAFVPLTVNNNCTTRVDDSGSSGSGGVAPSDLIIYIVVGVVAGVILIVAIAEIVRRSKNKRQDNTWNAALTESQTGVASRRQAPPPYDGTGATYK